MKRTVVVPCFNEERRLRLDAFELFFEFDVSLLFVDDGSTDRTRSQLLAFAARHPSNCQVILLERNSGKAEAIRQGILAAVLSGAKVVAYLDADLASPPAEMMRVLERVRGDVQVAIGSRVQLLGTNINRSPARHYLGRVFATSASLVLGLRVYDTQCGAKAFAVTPRLLEALSTHFESRWVFDIELLQRLTGPEGSSRSVAKENMVEIPLQEWRDVAGSKLGLSSMSRAGVDLTRLAARRLRAWRPTRSKNRQGPG